MLQTVCRRLLTQSRMRRNFMAVFAANLLAQALPFLALPIISRLYSPENYAGLAQFSSLVLVLVAVSLPKLDWLASAEKRGIRARAYITAGGIWLLVSTAALLVAVYTRKYQVLPLIQWVLIEPYVWMVPLAVLATGAYQLRTGWLMHRATLIPIAGGRLGGSLANVLVSVISGLMGHTKTGLLAGFSVAPLVASAVSLLRRPSRIRLPSRRSLTHAVTVVRAQKGTVFFSGCMGVVNTISLMLPLFLIGAYFSAGELGAFALAQRLSTAPLAAITGAMQQSFWAEANQKFDSARAELARLFKQSSVRLLWIGLALGAVLLASPLFLTLLLGPQWEQVGPILMALVPLVVSQIVASTLSGVMAVAKKVKWLLVWDVVRCLGALGCFVVARMLHWELIWAVLAYSVVMSIAYLILYRASWVVLCCEAAND